MRKHLLSSVFSFFLRATPLCVFASLRLCVKSLAKAEQEIMQTSMNPVPVALGVYSRLALCQSGCEQIHPHHAQDSFQTLTNPLQSYRILCWLGRNTLSAQLKCCPNYSVPSHLSAGYCARISSLFLIRIKRNFRIYINIYTRICPLGRRDNSLRQLPVR